MGLLALSFLGGVLTVLSPCVLPLLPIIVGGSLTKLQPWRPVIIAASLSVSVVLFTLLLKWSTAWIAVPAAVWSIISGSLVIVLGLVTLFPQFWEHVSVALRLSDRSNQLLNQSAQHTNWVGAVLVGLSLGPVFSSCSPTYTLILATVLPQTFFVGLINLLVYAVGLSSVLLLIAIFGQRAVRKLNWAANPNGFFRKSVGLVFIVVGILIVTGWMKQIETALVEQGFGVSTFESELVDQVQL